MSNTQVIIKGDDTFFNGKDCLAPINIITNLDLTGWSAKFTFQSATLLFQDISNYTIQPRFTAQQTSAFAQGVYYAKLVLIDNEGKVKTTFTDLPIRVECQVRGEYVD